MKKCPNLLLIIVSFCFLPFLLGAKNNVKRYIEREMKNDSTLNNAIVGIYAVNPKGEIIADWNGNFPMLTASTMKTITTGLGLITLGPDYKYSTKIGYVGEIDNGVLNGNLYLIGGGDPTLGSKDTIAYSLDSLFSIWVQELKKLNINSVNGGLVVDDSFFVREQIPDSWSWGNLGAYYGSTASGLSFAENGHNFILIPGDNIGDSVRVVSEYPVVPNLKLINNLYTGAPKSGDKSMYYVQDLAPVSLFNGSSGIDM